jgi:hypothetical protein
MEKPSSQSHLPEVEQDDILYLMFDDVTNTDHSERWENFANNHPILAAELRARITNEAKASAEYDKNSEDIRIRMMNTIVFAVNALEQAGRRIKDLQVKTTTNGDVAGEDQPLST